VLDGTVPDLGEDGVTMTAGQYLPTDVCDQGIAEKLGIPAAYLRRMREACPGLYDANVNGWLEREPVSVLAPLLLSRYRSPFTGAFSITPRLVAQVCGNGMTITRDARRSVHLGEKLEEGIRWSADTRGKQAALVTVIARDTVTSVLDPGYVERAVRELERAH
jgi:hypothetical protein